MRIILYDGGERFNLVIPVTILEQSDDIIASILVAILSLLKIQFYVNSVETILAFFMLEVCNVLKWKKKKHFLGFGFVLLPQKSKKKKSQLIQHGLSR